MATDSLPLASHLISIHINIRRHAQGNFMCALPKQEPPEMTRNLCLRFRGVWPFDHTDLTPTSRSVLARRRVHVRGQPVSGRRGVREPARRVGAEPLRVSLPADPHRPQLREHEGRRPGHRGDRECRGGLQGGEGGEGLQGGEGGEGQYWVGVGRGFRSRD